MSHSMRLVLGSFKPFSHFRPLQSAYRLKGSWWRIFLLAIVAFLVVGITSFMNIKYAGEMPEYAGIVADDRLLFVLSEVITDGLLGLITFVLLVLGGALLYWPFFQEVGFKRLAYIHSYVVFILLIGMVLQLPFIPFLHEPSLVSPYSLGVYVDLITNSPFWLYFSYSLSIFLAWGTFVQYAALKQSTTHAKRYVIFWIIGLNLVIVAIIAYMRTAF
ncbi:hypothetical protein [Guptibacillus hwajinpoensis]|uniref:hypothetical protein n=1 Tax=Guptibacillus hwajinpoensis TaxID=208199 RepID=UPI001CFD0672|nr:hypothetical protein [Pseudalkalibacillus hwajinpoensis]WLR59456.1 hypothetical protein LC071_20375 [Pseudalkalibacillus hwajinpoensis]